MSRLGYVEPITALSIAGSDSGGGAGIQADLRTFSAFSVHGTTAITALTAQNTVGVQGVSPVSTDFILQQINSVLSDFEVKATKTGMLASPQIVEAVGELARSGAFNNLVVDPVLVSTSGHALMQGDGVSTYLEALLPYADIVTPNLREAAVLCGVDVKEVVTHDDMLDLANQILSSGVRYVLVKGGHFLGDEGHSPDVLVGAGQVQVLSAERVDTVNDHGTGCSLSAAIAAGLAMGRSMDDSVRDAKSFVLSALKGGAEWKLGRGRGPIDHLGWNQ